MLEASPLVPLRILAFGDRTIDTGQVDDARRRPVIVANPPGDLEFRALIDRFLLAGGGMPVDLEATLRGRYPEAVVRQRGLAGESFEVWYVYRDGHWIGTQGDAK
jgi:hypothetical protein